MADVLCLGEILVDWIFTEWGKELQEASVCTKAAGGAPANTAVGLARLGVSTGFIGCTANDLFGQWLRAVLDKEKVDSRGVVVSSQAQTRMAYVVTTETGDRKLAEFSRIACADALLSLEDLQPQQFQEAKVLHFGSISLIADPSATATEQAVELARKNRLLVSYDPNVRLELWPSKNQCRATILNTLGWADIVKINEDELYFLTDSEELEAADHLRKAYDIPLLIVTLNARGAYISSAQWGGVVEGFSIQLVDTTGAGDGFNAGMIAGFLPYIKALPDPREALCSLPMNTITDIVRQANAIGALACTRAGAMQALPTRSEMAEFMNQSNSSSG